MAALAVYDLPDKELETFTARIASVTAADVRKTAQKYLQPRQSGRGRGGRPQPHRIFAAPNRRVELRDLDGARLDDLDARGPVTSFRGNPRQPGLADETEDLHRQADLAFGLCYPSPYHVGMSSLGFKSIYRGLHGLRRMHRGARLPFPTMWPEMHRLSWDLCTYESGRPVGDFSCGRFPLASNWSWPAWSLVLDLARIPALRSERAAHTRTFPLVVLGGPLTFSNPVPAGPFADVIVMGEAEELLPNLGERLARTT